VRRGLVLDHRVAVTFPDDATLATVWPGRARYARDVRWIVVTLCSIASMRLAAAQPAPVAGAPAPPTPAVVGEPAVASAVDPREDAAWQLYHEVFAALVRGEQARARDLAGELLRDHPDHPATRLVRGAHLGVGPGAADDRGDRPEGDEGDETRETASRGARAELAAFQTLHGIALGIEACVAADCNSGEAVFGLTLGGGALGALVSLNAAHDLTSGQRALLNSGTVWGAVNAGLLLVVTKPDTQAGALAMISGQGAGLIAGAALFALHPTAGQVGLANSGGQWAGALTGLVLAASGTHLDDREVSITLLAAIDAGIAGGAYLASRRPEISRGQTLVIDAGGIAGAVGGGSLGVVISGNFDDRTTPALAAVGAVAGLGVAAYFTRDWNEGRASSLHTYLAPPEHGHGGIAGISARW
jgi:hypothetical protein